MTGENDRLLLFALRDQKHAIPLQDVAEVLPMPSTFPVPWVPSYFQGVMNFHGSLVAVVDLADLLGLGRVSDDGNVLVLAREVGNVALCVDRVESIIPADDVLEEDESSLPLIERVLILPDGQVNKLAVEKLMQTITAAMQR